jgi:hypothetical protein
MADWLGCNQYILPAKRILSAETFTSFLTTKSQVTPEYTFKIGFYLENTTLEQQQWILEYNRSLTPHS